MPSYDYDLLVIGSGPAGQRAAIQAAKLNKRVGVIEKETVLGGASVNLGTIPSKTLREAVLYLSGYRERSVYGASYTVKQNITMADLLLRTDHVKRNELDVTRHQLLRNKVEVINGRAQFHDPHTLRVDTIDGHSHLELSAARIVIAIGTETTRDPHIPFNGQTIFTSDDIFTLERLPRTMAVVGAGVIGCEYASMFAALGVRVTIIDKRNELLAFVDDEISDHLAYNLRESRVTLRLGEEVGTMEEVSEEQGRKVKIYLNSGKTVICESVLYAIGRTGATARINLTAAGLVADDRGRLQVNEFYQTSQPHIYAVGDIIGFPALASTSMEQGRLAACHAFGVEAKSKPELLPYGIYTIPEISMVGKSEEDLTKEGVPYEVGKAQYREIARGQIVGDQHGLLKLIFHYETRELLGVHIIGEGATELVHIGQAVLSFHGTIDYFIRTVFNYPTFAECYKVAAFDGINRLGITLT
ncbi:MAG: Si-specific NAD(P)(+) transhydrogenase [Bryobacterales bacterium]|nr:Si-specific NAD(P)(+) transhydrogenase [Bryobacterales bacterium]